MRPGLVVRRLLRMAGLDVYRLRRSRVFAWLPDGRVVPLSPQDGFFYQPCIHPEGEVVAYHGNVRGPLRVWATCVTTGRTSGLTEDTTTAVHPSYSWDGQRIVFASDRAWGDAPIEVSALRTGDLPRVRLNLYVANADGSDARQITRGEGVDRRPCFRPDGGGVAFLSNRSGCPDLWIAELDRGEEPRCLGIEHQGWSPGRPWFSADARQVFFYGRPRSGGRDRICRVPAEGGQVEALAEDDRGDSHGPFVDWDGRALLMHSTRSGAFNIWELPLDGRAPRPLFPPGLDRVLHPTRSRNGIVAFDTPTRGPLRIGLRGGGGGAAPAGDRRAHGLS